MAGDWRTLHNEELNNLHSSPNIITMMKSRRMCWAGHLALMEDRRNAYTNLVKNLKRETHLEHLRVDRIILKWILKK
jgi:hypothetical protein